MGIDDHYHIGLYLHPYQADDVKALLLDATTPSDTSTDADAKVKASKAGIAAKGLTAAGASLLANEHLPETCAESKGVGDGSDRPPRDSSGKAAWESVSIEEFLSGMEFADLYLPIFKREHITIDILVDMTHEDLQSIGISAFGHRHRILKKVKELVHNGGAKAAEPVGVASAKHMGTRLIELLETDKDFIAVSEEVRHYAGKVVADLWYLVIIRCRAPSVVTETMGGQEGPLSPMKLSR